MLGKTKKNFFANRQTGVYLGTNTRMDTGRERERERGRERVREREGGRERRGREEELMSWTGRVLLCSVLCLYSLKEYMVSVQSEVCGIMDNQERKEEKTKKKCFHAQGNFFCTSGSFYFMFFVLSMVLRLDAEHIEN